MELNIVRSNCVFFENTRVVTKSIGVLFTEYKDPHMLRFVLY